MMIDTSTTAGKIEVMQAFEDGSIIQAYKYKSHGWSTIPNEVMPKWRWSEFDYRVKPQVEEAAKEYSKGKYPKCADHVDIRIDFKAGAKWQKEQDNEKK